MNRWKSGALAAGVLSSAIAFSGNAFAQGCASCYTSAAAGGPETAHALRSGILLLLFPPTIIFAGIIITLRRWKSAAPGIGTSINRQRQAGASLSDERTT